MVSTREHEDIGLKTLLQLDGEVFPMDSGYWVKSKVYRVESTKHIPHGIRYSQTLHDKSNKRVVGYDNAHGVKSKRKRFGGTRTVWDHKHKHQQVTPYEFENSFNLMEDFWKDVNGQISK